MRTTNGTETPSRFELLDVEQVARILNVSTRTVYRLADAGKMPRPTKLNALVRFNRLELESWINDGCPPVRTPKGGRP